MSLISKRYLASVIVSLLPTLAYAQLGDALRGLKDAAKEIEKGVIPDAGRQPPQPQGQPQTQIQQQQQGGFDSVAKGRLEERVKAVVSAECAKDLTAECVQKSSVAKFVRETCQALQVEWERKECFELANRSATDQLVQLRDEAKQVADKQKEPDRREQFRVAESQRRIQEQEATVRQQRQKDKELALMQRQENERIQKLSCLTALVPKAVRVNPPSLKSPSSRKLQCDSAETLAFVDRWFYGWVNGTDDGELDLASALTGIPIAKGIRSPGRTPMDWISIELDAVKELDRSKGKAPNGQSVDVVTCQADLYVKLKNPEIISCALNAGILRNSRTDPRVTYRNEAIDRFLNNPDLIKKAGGQVKFSINPQTIPSELQKGFAVIGVVEGVLRGVPDLQAIARSVNRHFSFFPYSASFSSMKNNVAWDPSLSDLVDQRCSAAGNRSRTCSCYKSELQSRFSLIQMNQLHYSSYHVFDSMTAPERASFYFPFNVSVAFGKLYPEAKSFLEQLKQKCEG